MSATESSTAEVSVQRTAVSQVLLVEDSPAQARATVMMVEAAQPNGRVNFTLVGTLAEALARLEEWPFDCVLLDLTLPDAERIEGVEAVRAAFPSTPIVVLTGLDDDEIAMAVLRAGAQGYLAKAGITGSRIVRAIQDAVQRARIFDQFEDQQRQRLKMKDDVLSHVSHELRTPLTAIHNFVAILLDGLDGELNPAQTEHLQIVFRNVERLVSMVEELLDATRAQDNSLSVDLQSTSAAASVSRVLDTMSVTAADNDIELRSSVAPDLPAVFADPQRLDQILINLVHNAVKFTPAGGRVTVEARPSEEEPGFVCLSVTDTGIGISADDIPKVFERLRQLDTGQRTSRKGLGLGLFITQRLVTSHKGRIWVDSEPGQGSTFSFTLPVFALEELLAPAVIRKDGAAGLVAVLAVDVDPGTTLTAGTLVKVLDEVRCVMNESTLRRDVVLPNISGSHAAGFAFLVVAVDEPQHCDVITTRIEEELALSKLLAHHAVRPSIETTTIDIGPRQADGPAEDALKEIARAVEELVVDTISQRSARNTKTGR